MNELPDAPWVTAENELPDAPWAAPSSLTATNVVKSIADVPVLGELARKADAAISAAIAPAIDPLLPESYEKLSEPTFSERYAHKLKLVREDQGLQQFRQDYPATAGLTNLGGTVAATIPFGGVGTGPLWAQMGRSALTGGVVSGTDAALRGQDIGPSALEGAAFGAAGPAVVRGIGAALPGAARAVAPTLEEIGTAKALDYKAVNDLGVSFKPAAVNNMASGILRTFENEGRTADVAAPAFKVLERLESRKTIATVDDIDNTRKILGQMARGSTSPDTLTRINAGVARDAIRAIDTGLENFRPGDFATGEANYAQAIQHLKNARANAAVGFQAEALDRAHYRAENTAAAAHSGMNFENALRQQLRTIINNPARAAQFPEVIRNEMQKIVRGEGTRNSIRYIGNLLGGGGGIGAIGTAVAGHMALPGLGAFAPVLGYGLKKAGNLVTERAVKRLDEMVRAQSPLARARAAAMPAQIPRNLAPLQTLLQAQSTRGAQPLYFPP